MFGKLFGQKQDQGNKVPEDPNQPYLAPLQPDQISRVVEIINETDDDDAEDADKVLRARGCANMYALWHQNRIVGVTGFAATEASNDTAWLSWTYLEEQARGKALGRFMIDELLLILNKHKIRKIFIATSDYMEGGEDVYADARKFYTSLGSKLELTLPGFYSADESKLIYGLVNPGMGKKESLDDLGDRGMVITGIELDEDSDDVGAILWKEDETGSVDAERVKGLANSQNFRVCFLALPADISDVMTAGLTREGFDRIGMLDDYYALGLGQVWWRFQLT